MFELVALSTEWLLNENADPESFQNLTYLINRAYDKAHYKYKVFDSQRVKNHTTFASDFAITVGSSTYLYLLLAPEDTLEKLHTEFGYFRDFTAPYDSLEGTTSCDIPEKYASLFDFSIEGVELKINVVDKDFKLTSAILNRCLGTLGIMAKKEDEDLTLKNVEITCFTSYLRDSAAKLLEIVIDRCLLDPKIFRNHSDLPLNSFKKITILGDFVREHNLERFYIGKCGFRLSSKEDFVVQPGAGAATIFEEGTVGLRVFHIAFMERVIEL